MSSALPINSLHTSLTPSCGISPLASGMCMVGGAMFVLPESSFLRSQHPSPRELPSPQPRLKGWQEDRQL